MMLILLQIIALVFLNAGIVALFEILNTKTKRSRFFAMAVGCFAVSSLLFYLTAPTLPIWQAPLK